MVQSSKKRKDKKKLAASHNKSWIWGRHAVLEILEAGQWPIHKLHLSDSLGKQETDHAISLANALNVKVMIDTPDRLRELCRTTEHQGYLAKMKPFPYATLNDLENVIGEKGDKATIAVLDRIQDPHNFGAIVRSAEVLGITAIIISTTDQADVTPAVARASSGAVNHIPIFQTEDLAQTLEISLQNEGTIIAATEKGTSLDSENPFDSNASAPIVIILGNEGQGISSALLELCSHQVQIPQKGNIRSLNIAAAAAILFYEATRSLQDPATH